MSMPKRFFVQDRVADGLRLGHLALFLIHGIEQVERFQQEVAAAAGRVEERDLADRLLLDRGAIGVADVVFPVLGEL